MTSLARISVFAVVFAAALALIAASGSAVSAAQLLDHFKAIGPDKSQANTDDSLFTPNQYEAAVTGRPDSNGLTFFSLCRRAPWNSSSAYGPFAANNADTIVGDTTFPLVDGSQCYNPQNEQNIVINPTNSSNIVTSANDYRYDSFASVYTSSDGGNTWTDVVLPGWSNSTGAVGLFKHAAGGGDPVLAFGPDGRLYYTALAYDFSYPNHTPSGVAIASSTDGGLHWSAPVMINYQSSNNFFNDKEWVAAGSGGNVYVTWTLFKSNKPQGYISSNIMGAVSHDYGATWSAPIAVSDPAHPYDQGSSPAVAPDGTVYVAYEGNQASNVARDATVVARSTDGGLHFTNTEVGRVYDDANCYPLNVAQGRQRLSFEQFRVNSFPDLAIDPSTGRLAITWADDQLNAGCGTSAPSFSGLTNNQVKLITSSNGTSWTAPAIITSGADKVYPAVGANDGRIVVGYYTRDFSPTPSAADHTCGRAFLNTSDPSYPYSAPIYDDSHAVCLDYAVSSSTDGYTSETRVSNQSSNPYNQFSGSFIGDYTGVAVDSSGVAHAAWTDFRGNPGVTTTNQDTVVGNGF